MKEPGTTTQPAVAVVGGGINGLSCAWQLALRGTKVTIFERNKLFEAQYERSSGNLFSAMEHFANGELRLAYETLYERQWLLQQCPQLCSSTLITVPIYHRGPRKKWLINAGLYLYDNILGTHALPKHQWLTRAQLLAGDDDLTTQTLLGAYRYGEINVDEGKLQRWLAQQARAAGVQIVDNSPVRHIGSDGSVRLDSDRHQFDLLVNATGQWSVELLRQSGLVSKSKVKLVRESRLLLAGSPRTAYQIPLQWKGRSLYVLPWYGNTLVGAITKAHCANDEPTISTAETDDLLDHYNQHFIRQRSRSDIIKPVFTLNHYTTTPIAAGTLSNEYLFERQQKLLTVFGGHWTTARALGQKVATQLLD